MPAAPTPSPDAELELELYKSLRSEIAGYLEKVPALWLQKFVLLGGVIAFVVTSRGNLEGSSKLLAAAILAIPVLAMLLDAKIGEYGLHARAVSLFIQASFASAKIVAWEAALWGDGGSREMVAIVKLRSLMTTLVTLVPTLILIVVAGLAIDEVNGQDVLPPSAPSSVFFYSSLGVAALYVLCGMVLWYLIWPATRGGRGWIPHRAFERLVAPAVRERESPAEAQAREPEKR